MNADNVDYMHRDLKYHDYRNKIDDEITTFITTDKQRVDGVDPEAVGFSSTEFVFDDDNIEIGVRANNIHFLDINSNTITRTKCDISKQTDDLNDIGDKVNAVVKNVTENNKMVVAASTDVFDTDAAKKRIADLELRNINLANEIKILEKCRGWTLWTVR